MLEALALVKTYAGQRAVDGVSFTLPAEHVLALLGPSGSGKSTLLAIIAGLEQPDSGDVLWDGRSLRDVPTHRRGFGLMFQDYALFPHRNVAENVAFGLRMQGQPRAEVDGAVQRALDLVGLAGFERRDVNTLSGGEQQRVALARALAPRPRLLMLDEPLGALDRALRERLLDELHGILRRLRQTAIYVTHDQEEAFALADQVVILRAGRVAQRGTPAEIYARPASRFVAEFLGQRNLLPARLEARDGRWVARTPVGELPLAGAPAAASGAEQTVLLRAEGVSVAEAGPAQLEGVLADKSFRGRHRLAEVRVGSTLLSFELPAAQRLPAIGEPLRLRVDPAAVHVMPAEDAAP